MRGDFYAGLDLGQASDYTALVIIERYMPETPEPGLEGKPCYALRHAERWRGVPYTELVVKVGNLVQRIGGCKLVVDATGVGRPVIDLFRLGKMPSLVPVTIHGGSAESWDDEFRGWRVPKRDLVGTLSILLQQNRLRVAAALPLAAVLVQELRTFRVTIDSATSHESFSSWRESDHDDLVLGSALAVWYAEKIGGLSVRAITPRISYPKGATV